VNCFDREACDRLKTKNELTLVRSAIPIEEIIEGKKLGFGIKTRSEINTG
jgi:hypothetical protein